GHSEMTGVWAWKLETLKAGESATITFALEGLEKGDWTETEVFYRGAGDVIGATKMDDALLNELRRQEEVLTGDDEEDEDLEEDDGMLDDAASGDEVAVEAPEPLEEIHEQTAPSSAPKQTLFDYTEGDA
ncbi:MAG: hypothetical protein ACPHCZ_01055, partial [Candidatus Poseidoniaceae archaeon]